MPPSSEVPSLQQVWNLRRKSDHLCQCPSCGESCQSGLKSSNYFSKTQIYSHNLDSIFSVLFLITNLDHAGLHHGHHLLPADVAIVIQIINVEAVPRLLGFGSWKVYNNSHLQQRMKTFEENVEPQNPLLSVNIISTSFIEELVNPVHKNIIRHGKIFIQKLSKSFPVNLTREAITLLD